VKRLAGAGATGAALIVLGLLTLAAPAAAASASASSSSASTAAAGATVDQVTVTLDREQVVTPVGGRFTIRTRLVNDGDSPTGPLIAHLNVASLTSDVYVDPEDWSTQRTQWVDPLDPGQDLELTWRLQAVNVGSFDSYVVLLPTADRPGTSLSVSPSVRLSVSSRQTLSGGGVLPVVIAVPALLALLVGYRARSRRRPRS
jgi:hypothetical protein